MKPRARTYPSLLLSPGILKFDPHDVRYGSMQGDGLVLVMGERRPSTYLSSYGPLR